jgi:two-component system LytT family response regulator
MKKYTAISIDDDPIFLLLLEKLFQKIAYVDLIESHTNPVAGVLSVVNKEPDFLFLDMEMPMIDGFEAIQMLKNRPITIVVTSHSPTYQGIKQMNPDAVLTKPVMLPQLKNVIIKLLNERNMEFEEE